MERRRCVQQLDRHVPVLVSLKALLVEELVGEIWPEASPPKLIRCRLRREISRRFERINDTHPITAYVAKLCVLAIDSQCEYSYEVYGYRA